LPIVPVEEGGGEGRTLREAKIERRKKKLKGSSTPRERTTRYHSSSEIGIKEGKKKLVYSFGGELEGISRRRGGKGGVGKKRQGVGGQQA